MDQSKFESDLIRDEGERLKPYRDSVGKLTIGVGRNLDDKGISHDEAMFMLKSDINETMQDCREVFTGWSSFSEARQRALANMMFNMGRPTFLTFRRMLAAIAHGDWQWAADEALDSKWAGQVGERAERIARMLREG